MTANTSVSSQSWFHHLSDIEPHDSLFTPANVLHKLHWMTVSHINITLFQKFPLWPRHLATKTGNGIQHCVATALTSEDGEMKLSVHSAGQTAHTDIGM
jgi:hypothetical protein